jgi:amino acid transporter
MRQIMDILLLLSRFAAFYAFGIVMDTTNNRWYSLISFFSIFNLGTISHFIAYKKFNLNEERKWRETGMLCNNIVVFVFPFLFFLIPNFPLIHLFILDPVCLMFLGGTVFISMALILIDKKSNP